MPRLRIIAIAAALASVGQPALARDVVVHAGQLFDGNSRKVRRNVSIVIHDDRIVAVQAGFVRPEGAEVIDLSTRFVLPGLIDTHVHLLTRMGKVSPTVAAVTQTAFDTLMGGVADARATLMAGFTSVRDVAGYTPAIVALKKAIAAGDVEGPRMWVSGSALSPTGGHADFANGFDPQLTKPEWTDGIVDGAEAAVTSVRRHHREGTDLIKIVPSGGVATVGDDPNAQLMTDEEIGAVVRTAHTLHMKVAAHAHGTQAIEHAAALGVDSIEHGSFGTDAGVFEHGTNAREFALMVKAGMTPVDAMLSATAGAADLIGDAADIGSIRPGRYADLIAVDGDPVSTIAQLEHVGFVMKDGKVVKNDFAR